MTPIQAFHRPGKGYCEMTVADIAIRAGIPHDDAQSLVRSWANRKPAIVVRTKEATGDAPSAFSLTPAGIAEAEQCAAVAIIAPQYRPELGKDPQSRAKAYAGRVFMTTGS